MNDRMERQKVRYLDFARILIRTMRFMGRAGIGLYLTGSIFALGKMAISLMIPYLYEQFMYMVQEGIPYADMLRSVGWCFTLLVVLVPLVCMGRYVEIACVNRCGASMQKAMFAHIMNLPICELEMDRTDKVMRATANVYETKQIFSGQAMVLFFQFVICFFGAFFILLWNRPTYGWIGALVSVITFWVIFRLNTRLSGFERRALEANSVLAGDMADMLHNLPIVRLYQLQPTLGRKYACASKQAYQARLQYKWMRGFTDGILDFIAFSAQTLVLLAGILQFDRGGSAAQLVFASSMYALMLSAVRDLGSAVMFMQEGIESAKRMYQLLDRPTEQSCGDGDADEVDTDEMDADESAVAFRHVTFSYMGDKNVLDDVSISVPKGAFVAIVGGSGSGKTTIAKLIMGMYDLKHGHIYVGGTNIACTSKDRLREKIAYIPQEPTLFYGTVQQNVRLWADGGEGTAYLRQVALDLDGDTPVGEMGKALSGGQAQRVTIARALAHDAELYILDEATSALDYETERIIRRVIERDLAGKTCICITHRLHTIVNADCIIVMEGGKVIEEGTHSQLLSAEGAYASLYRKWEEA